MQEMDSGERGDLTFDSKSPGALLSGDFDHASIDLDDLTPFLIIMFHPFYPFEDFTDRVKLAVTSSGQKLLVPECTRVGDIHAVSHASPTVSYMLRPLSPSQNFRAAYMRRFTIYFGMTWTGPLN